MSDNSNSRNHQRVSAVSEKNWNFPMDDETRWNLLTGFARVTQFCSSALDKVVANSATLTQNLQPRLSQALRDFQQVAQNKTRSENETCVPEDDDDDDESFEEISRVYFQRWAQQVQQDADRQVAEARYRQSVQLHAQETETENEEPSFNHPSMTQHQHLPGLSLLMEPDLVLQMETECGSFEIVNEDLCNQPDSADWQTLGTHSVDTKECIQWFDTETGKFKKDYPWVCRRIFCGVRCDAAIFITIVSHLIFV